jgi:dinuclear metal center YbgI/SA1388 family protein
MAKRTEIISFCDELLQTGTYRDIALNGLQIEGRDEIHHITVAVSCNQATIDAAIANKSGAILVHHGLVLNGQVGHIAGPVRQRLKDILSNDLNLIGYHLPLDGQPEMGNNACLARDLELEIEEPLETYGPPAIGYICRPQQQSSVSVVREQLAQLTGQPVISLAEHDRPVRRIAVLCGSGSPALEEAAMKDCQVLLTGDAKEPTMALARELGMTVLVGGHEATERLGVQELAKRLQQAFEVSWDFASDPNPL